MSTDHHRTFVYVGLAGEGEYIGAGGLYRRAADGGEWQSLTEGLPPDPQVRSLLMHPSNAAILYAGTHRGPYRSDDRGEHWEALEAPQQGTDVWSLAFHPQNPSVIYAGY
ncbi:MAG: WD40/YVTN/BNR-like repeat-containing protein, partial [Candidatus Entotheonellia bacterium]